MEGISESERKRYKNSKIKETLKGKLSDTAQKSKKHLKIATYLIIHTEIMITIVPY